MSDQPETLKGGYYWATQGDSGERQIVEILEGDIYICGDDKTYNQEDFENYKELERTIKGALILAHSRGCRGLGVDLSSLMAIIKGG